jgi:NADH dehydrogenase FAD-containing subunit
MKPLTRLQAKKTLASRFVRRIGDLVERVRSAKRSVKVVVVGGGAGGAEIAFAIHERLRHTDFVGEKAQVEATVTLVTRGTVLSSHPKRARDIYLARANEVGIEVREGTTVKAVEAGLLYTVEGGQLPFDECLWCIQAAPANWIASTGLPTSAVPITDIEQITFYPFLNVPSILYMTIHVFHLCLECLVRQGPEKGRS